VDPFDISKLDEVIHGRVRLGIMSILASAEVATFSELKDALGVTQGNLSVHLRKLEEAGYVKVEKRFHDRKPQTSARFTPKGRTAFTRYLEAMSSLINDESR